MEKKLPSNVWTKEEEDELLSLIAQRKHNLTKAFRDFHLKHPTRTMGAISARWYSHLRSDNSRRVCLVNVSKNAGQAKPSLFSRLWNYITKQIF